MITNITWQHLQIMREEAVNKNNNFTDEQRIELLNIVDELEIYADNLLKRSNLRNFIKKTKLFELKYIRYGGNAKQFEDKIDEVGKMASPLLLQAAKILSRRIK